MSGAVEDQPLDPVSDPADQPGQDFGADGELFTCGEREK